MQKSIFKVCLLPIIATVFIFSCEKTEVKPTKELIIDTIDVNADGIIDFKLEYYEIQTFDVPSSAGSRIGKITPINGNKLLYKNNKNYLFLEAGDTITSNREQNNSWFPYGADLISNNRVGAVYDTLWEVNSDLEQNYYLGIQLEIDNVIHIGWIKLDFDLETGEVYLLDSFITADDTLIITPKE